MARPSPAPFKAAPFKAAPFKAARLSVDTIDGIWYVSAGGRNLGSYNPATRSVRAGKYFGLASSRKKAVLAFVAVRDGGQLPPGFLSPHPIPQVAKARNYYGPKRKKRAA